jgi:hypothetical protein
LWHKVNDDFMVFGVQTISRDPWEPTVSEVNPEIARFISHTKPTTPYETDTIGPTN